jgi:hypothetical protein
MKTLPIAAALLLAAVAPAHAADPPATELQQLRDEIDALRRSSEARLRVLEERLRQAEQASQSPAPPPPQAAPAAPAGGGGFNPALSLILAGQYVNSSRDPAGYRIAGFVTGGEIGLGRRGLGIGESELGIAANIDPQFYGSLALALHPDDTASVEEAFVQTTALPNGLTLKFGRFLSGIGYLNEQHAHTWDFADNPLAYQAFLGTQFAQDGLQARWLLPTDQFLELNAEVGGGGNFPGASASRNGAGAAALSLRTGGDWGASSSWRTGVSALRTSPREREAGATDRAGNEVSNLFSGRSSLWVLDGVWKWAPNGNATRTNFKLQGEWFRRRERGTLIYDAASAASAGSYASAQSGFYMQGVYQFMPAWRVGLRLDSLNAGTVDFGTNAAFLGDAVFNPRRVSAMLDWSPSEFSRVRLQIADDRSRLGEPDHQMILQYQMSLGAHGAHGY